MASLRSCCRGPLAVLSNLVALTQVFQPIGCETRLLLGGCVVHPVAVETGKLLVNRGVLGFELEGLLVVDLGILEAAGLCAPSARS